MFCDGCGNSVQPGQSYCSKCGKQIVGTIAPTFTMPGRVQRHLHLLAILWLAFSAFNTIGGLILLILGNVLFPHLHEMKDVPTDVPTGFLTALFGTLGIIVLAKAAFGFLAGWGLLQRESWARTFTWFSPLYRCSSTFRSARPWEFTRCGCCCPQLRSRNTRRWWRRSTHDVLLRISE